MARILIVDDERSVRDSVSMILRYNRHETVEVPNGREALAAIKSDAGFDLVICDVKMPEMDGLECLEEIKKLRPELTVLMISGHGDVRTAVEATKLGAFDFFEKPLDQDRLLLAVRNACERVELKNEVRELRGHLLDRWHIIGESPAMKAIRATIDRIAPTDARVLVTGENGTGKELVARNLHLLSKRSKAPFVDVNCAAIPEDLIESELFGHEKGAFTGASARKIGRFEQAHKGTLFLDEIGDMSLSAQAKVLRILEIGVVQRVGGQDEIKVDVRVIAATNRDLETDVKEGRFREDLLYRLNVIPIHLPPLRERPGDIPALLERFTADLCKKYDLEPRTYSNAALEHLSRRPWAGNIRELRNFAERMILLTTDSVIDIGAIAPLEKKAEKIDENDVFLGTTFEEFKANSERIFLEKKLRENDWNIKKTAEELGMQRSNLYKKIERYHLK